MTNCLTWYTLLWTSVLDMIFRLWCHVSHDLVTWSSVAVEWLCMEGSRRFHMEHHGISWKSMEGHGRFQNILLINAVLHSPMKVYIRAAPLAQVTLRELSPSVTLHFVTICDLIWDLSVISICDPICDHLLWQDHHPFCWHRVCPVQTYSQGCSC